MPLTDYERGRLVLQAFGLLDGWGRNDEKGVFKSFSLDERLDKARAVVEFAITKPDDKKETP